MYANKRVCRKLIADTSEQARVDREREREFSRKFAKRLGIVRKGRREKVVAEYR